MNTKYCNIMNTSGLNGKLLRLDTEHHKKLFNIKCHVNEKIHGESFRVGIDDSGIFIGQKNLIFYDFDKHPNWNKFSDELFEEINLIIHYIRKLKTNIIFFGELHGSKMQAGFTYPFDKLQVRWFDIKTNARYFTFTDKQAIFVTLSLISPPSIGVMTLKEALALDIENIHSQVANENFIEGVVITPMDNLPDWWRFPSRLIFKYKTKKYTEQKKGKHKKEKPINNFVSEFVDFITKARIDHAIQSLQERNVEILYEMKDLQHIPKTVIADIEKEENDGKPLIKEDRKYLSGYIPKFYKTYLDNILNEKINSI